MADPSTKPMTKDILSALVEEAEVGVLEVVQELAEKANVVLYDGHPLLMRLDTYFTRLSLAIGNLEE